MGRETATLRVATVVALGVLCAALWGEILSLRQQVQTLETSLRSHDTLSARTSQVVLHEVAPRRGPRGLREEQASAPKINGENLCASNTQFGAMALRFPIVCFGTFPFAFIWLGGANPPTDLTGSEGVSAVVYLRCPHFQIPATVGILSQLGVFAGGNAIGGTIPSEFGLNTKLVMFHITEGSLTGTIPSQFGTLQSLATFELYHNPFLQGGFPSQIGNLRLLDRIDVRNTTMTGTLPSQLGLLTLLTYVEMSDTPVSGTLPSQLGQLVRAEVLEFGRHQLSGAVPSEYGRLTNMRLWAPWYGSLTAIPSQLGLASSLTEITMVHNDVTFLPSELFQLPRCTYLSFYANNLQGPLVGNWVANNVLRTLTLDINSITGPIPSQIALLSTLGWLSLSSNQLSSSVPSEIGLLSDLRVLRLHSNHLEGQLPSEIGQLTVLKVLTLEANALTGTIPETFLLLSSLTQLSLSNNNFAAVDSSVFRALLERGVNVTCATSGLANAECAQPTETTPPRLSWDVYVAVASICAVGLLLVLASLWFTSHFRAHPVVKVANPSISMVMLVGLVLFLATIVAFGFTMLDVSKQSRDLACKLTPQLISYGSVLLLSAITVRSYPIYRIFSNPEMQSVRVTPHQLLLAVGVALFVDVMLAAPVALEVKANRDNTHGCTTDENVALAVFNLLFLGGWALAAVFMCWAIRNVPSDFQETQQFAKATYNLLTFGVAMLVVPFSTSEPTPQFLSVSLCIVLCVLNFVVLLYVPRMRRVYALRQNNKSALPAAELVHSSELTPSGP